MEWIEAKVLFDSDNQQLAKELIADIFQDLGVKGVSVQEPGFESPVDWAEEALRMPDHYAVTGYFPNDGELRDRCRFLEEKLSTLQSENGIAYKVSYTKIDEEDWAESWKTYFWPQKVSQRIVVKPTWRKYAPDPSDIVIEIDPGMAFGIGSHPTTGMCLELIEKFMQSGKAFLDVGTGSGILMIAAAKLGAGKLMGVDNDPHAVEIARENLIRNRIESDRFGLATSSLLDGIDGRFDLVVANITTDVILDLLDRVTTVLSKGGILVVSGIIEANRNGIIKKMTELGFGIIETETRQEWVALAARFIGKDLSDDPVQLT